MAFFLDYLSGKTLKILAPLKEDRQPVMTVKNCPVWPDLQRPWPTPLKGGFYRFRGQAAKLC
ncbi:MAG: hypothetical protein JO336_07770 [Acidobacteriia bacterium]|nr:hypothetical protein [Terriglobia bacterium]